MDLITLVLTLFVIYLGVQLYTRFFNTQDQVEPPKTKSASIPGLEKSDPKYGNILDIGAAGSFHQFLMSLHSKFGPIASFWWNNTWTVSIASADLFKQNAKAFNRPEELYLMFEPVYRDGTCYARDDEWRKMRRPLDAAYSRQAISQYYGKFNELGKNLVSKWSSLPKEEHIDVNSAMFTIAVRSIMDTSFGVHYSNEQNLDKFEKSYHKIFNEMQSVLKGKQMDESSFLEDIENFRATVNEASEAWENNPPAPDQRTCYIDLLLSSDLPKKTKSAECISTAMAGIHTTAGLLTWAVYYIADYPLVQQKLYAEIKEVIGDSDVNAETYAKLQYTLQVLDETLRCSALAPYAARDMDEDIILGGHTIPARTPVVHALGVASLNPEVWPEPERFDPERFSPEQVKARPHHSFEPYGFAGKRKCPGFRHAYADGATLLAYLIRAFKLKTVPGQTVEYEYGFVTHPKEDIWITVEKRS